MTDLLDTLADLVQNRYFGKYRGLVMGHEFPVGRGRLKVQVPAVLGDVEVMAEACVPYAGDGVGFLMLPDVGTGVWVEFEGGDPSYPIWVGCFWGDGQLPVTFVPDQKAIFTNQIEVTLDDSTSTFSATSSNGGSLEIASDVTTAAGMAGGKVTVSTSSVTTETPGIGKIEVSASGTNVNSGGMEVM